MGKYRKFDLETLQHQKEDSKLKRFLQDVLTFVVTLFFLTIIFYLLAAYFFETPQQRLLSDENRRLQREYKRQYYQYKQLEKAVSRLQQMDRDLYRVIFEAEPPKEEELTNFDTLDQLKSKQIISWNTRDIKQQLRNWKKLEPQYKKLFFYVKKHIKDIQHIPSIQPVPNSGLRFVVYGYGRKIDPIYKTPSFHQGIDYSAPGGTPVFATATGVVTEANQKIRGLGQHIKIDHGNNFSTLYAHLSEMLVSAGDHVRQGQVIGYVGNSGKALLPLLHYEVHYKGKPLNPVYFFFMELTPTQFYKLKQQADHSGISLD